MITDTHVRSKIKMIMWRLIAGSITFLMIICLIPWIGTAAGAALTYALIESVIKLYAYYQNERFWNKVKWGRQFVKENGCCIWMTGFSGSGKTTIALKLVEELEKHLKRVEYLDGDIVRRNLCADLGFTKEDRDENIRRISYVSSYLSETSVVIAAFISPYKVARDKARSLNKSFIEVFVDAPIEVCEERDVKGLYAKVRSGEIKNFTGISDPYEAPLNPEVHIRTDKETVNESVAKIMAYLKENKHI